MDFLNGYINQFPPAVVDRWWSIGPFVTYSRSPIPVGVWSEPRPNPESSNSVACLQVMVKVCPNEVEDKESGWIFVLEIIAK